HPLVGDGVAIVLLYTTLATRSLTQHARQVQQPLDAHDLVRARQHVAWMVGRDTEHLDEGEITRATVESVAENSVDGVTAPLLFAFMGGPIGAMVYKAINTLDSTFGYKNERYLQFGWAAARLDDVANFIPARLTALMVPVAAKIIGLDGRQAWVMWQRDRQQHPSPNGGQTEAAMAGALNVRLGGENSYFGVPSCRPTMGDAQQDLCSRHIGEVIHLMWTTSALVASAAFAGWLILAR
ncbi:MAG: cobalamin biosynthesis protein CobD, partial [Desulfuromonadaceae bacterium]|nr:cobalamin biosynthesis protein CobD [Desulfuromonadaceae bacterium]